jgi:hypothetical protein
MDNIESQIADAEVVICDTDYIARKAELDKLFALNKRWQEFWSSFSQDAAAIANRYEADANLLGCMEEDMALFARHAERMIRLRYAREYIG